MINDLPETEIDNNIYEKESHGMLFYDVPAKWNKEKIITTFKKLGLVQKISIKFQYKYKSVKAEINLFNKILHQNG